MPDDKSIAITHESFKTGNDLALPGKVTRTSLELPDDLPEAEWRAVGERLTKVESGILWWIGDWWAFGERKAYGERKAFADELEAQGGFAYQTCRDAAWVSGQFRELSRRRDSLPWSFHREVAGLSTPQLQDDGLGWAVSRLPDVTIRDLRGYVRSLRREGIYAETMLPEGKWRVFYADPPWMYGNERPLEVGEPNDHYPTMATEDICKLDVANLSTDDAVLFLWCTSAILHPDAFDVLKAWGFEYKTTFIWDKIKHNMGHYNSVRHEILIVATKGSCTPDVRKLFDSVVSEERTVHSRKPECFYEIIETLYPYGKRLELFAREPRFGWDSYGNEACHAAE